MTTMSRFPILLLLTLLLLGCSQTATETPTPDTDQSVTLTVIDPTERAAAADEQPTAAPTNEPAPTAAAETENADAAEPETAGDSSTDDESRESVELVDGAASIAGELAANGEQQYMVTGAAEQVLNVTYEADNDSVLSIYNPDGSVLAIDAADNCCPPFAQDGEYAMIVRSGASDTSYTIDVAVTDGAADSAATDASDQSADGDDTLTPSEGEEARIELSELNGAIVGNTLAAGATDTWLLEASEGQAVSITLFPYPTKLFTMTSPAGDELVFTDNGGVFVADIPESGDYQIAVTGDFAGNYSLTVDLFGGAAGE